jgi:uncharacterized protein (TIGR02246 family)
MKEMEGKKKEKSNTFQADEDSIRNFVEQFAHVWNQHDARAMASCFVNDGEFTNVIGEHAVGRDEIERIHFHPFKTILKETVITIKSIRSKWIHNKDIAAIDVSWESTGNKTPEGQPVPTRYGLLNLITNKHSDGSWKIVVGHNVDYTLAYSHNDSKKA